MEKVCKRCDKLRPHHAHGYCKSCYGYVYHLDKIKTYNCKQNHELTPDIHQVLTSKCKLCSIDILIELHHADGNHKNKAVTNLVGLCPLHHKMARTRPYKYEINKKLRKMGYIVPYSSQDKHDHELMNKCQSK